MAGGQLVSAATSCRITVNDLCSSYRHLKLHVLVAGAFFPGNSTLTPSLANAAGYLFAAKTMIVQLQNYRHGLFMVES